MATRKVYWFSLGGIALASAYPLYMGGIMLWAFWQNGGIDVANYPRYIIPYTPICISLLISTALLPLAFKHCKRFTLPALSLLGALLFLASEIAFEQIVVFANASTRMSVETWQLLSCIALPEVRATVWDSLNIRYNPAFKIHFYAISLLMILAVIGVIYGFYQMAHTRNNRKKPVIAQLISVLVFIGLCILACFTAFFRGGSIRVSPLSAILMTLFFLTFGMTAGVYAGTWLYEKQKWLSVMLPAAIAMLITLVMYIGEMVMLGWKLYQFGSGLLFEPLGGLVLSIVDILTVLLSGVGTYFLLMGLRGGKEEAMGSAK